MELDTRIGEMEVLNVRSLLQLSSKLGIPSEAAIECLGPATPGQSTLLLGALELSALAGRALRASAVTPRATIGMMNKVAELFEQLDKFSVQLWLSARDDSDCAIARDFIDLERSLAGTDIQEEAAQSTKRFKAAVSKNGECPNFDVIADALSRRQPQFVRPLIIELMSAWDC